MKKETSLIERFRKWLNMNQLIDTPEMPEYLYPIIGAQIDARLAREADFHDKRDEARDESLICGAYVFHGTEDMCSTEAHDLILKRMMELIDHSYAIGFHDGAGDQA